MINQKLIIQIYGLLRMILGLSQLVGLLGGLFLLEFIIQYSSMVHLMSLGREVVAVIYFIVFFRAMFHLIAGIGIARFQPWVKFFLMFGWPFVLLVTFLLFQVVTAVWVQDGLIAHSMDVLSGPRLLVYGLLACGDIFLVSPLIIGITKKSFDQKSLLKVRNVCILFFVSIIIFWMLIFLARPVRQGFHQGFYKSRGEKVSQGEMKTLLQDRPQAEMKLSQQKANPDELVNNTDKQVVLSAVNNDLSQKTSVNIFEKKKEAVEASSPVQIIIGLLAVVCLFIGFLIYALNLKSSGIDAPLSLGSLMLFVIGFLLLGIFGVINLSWPVILTGFSCSILNLWLVFMRI